MKGLRKYGHKFLIMGLFVILLIIYMSMRKIEDFRAIKVPATIKPKTRECMTYCDNRCASQSDTTPHRDFDSPNQRPVASAREQCTSTCYQNSCEITQLQWDKNNKRYNPA